MCKPFPIHVAISLQFAFVQQTVVSALCIHVAIREALVNALIHADYQGQGGIIIEKYSDRFEFSNPGSLLISFDQILRGGVSECRNKSLQTMFTVIGAAEKAGSGIDKIRTGWNSQHWRFPIARERMHPDRVIWVLPMLSLIPEESLERLKNRFGSKFSKFSKLEVQALVTADVEGYVDNARMRQITGHHASDITKLLQNLVSREILLQNGQGRWTQYCLPSNLDHNSLHIDNHSVHKIENSTDQWDALTKIAEPAKLNKRLSPKEMESIILQLCNDHWLTRKQISDLLQRNPDGLRSRFLTSMVEHGLLELRYPDKPNRTDQAYKAALPPQMIEDD
jgi:ATP-dependent DNA helicase RecG